MRLLLVEHIRSGSRTARKLRWYGHTVATASSVLECSAVSGQFDCGIFELALSDGHGADVAARLLRTRVIDRAVFFCEADEASRERLAEIGDWVSRDEGLAALERTISSRAPRARSGVQRRSSPPVAEGVSPRTGRR